MFVVTAHFDFGAIFGEIEVFFGDGIPGIVGKTSVEDGDGFVACFELHEAPGIEVPDERLFFVYF